MKTYVVIYEGFAHFEVMLASYFLKTQGEVITVGITKESIVSCEGYRIIPDLTIEALDIDDIDVLIVPGGDPDEINHSVKFYDVLRNANEKKKTIGGICSGVYHLAKAHILEDKKYTTTIDISEFDEFNKSNFMDENYVVDGNVITAKANGYVDFGIELGRMMDIYEDENDLKETIEFFKYFKD